MACEWDGEDTQPRCGLRCGLGSVDISAKINEPRCFDYYGPRAKEN
jgi:hypothetical protein